MERVDANEDVVHVMPFAPIFVFHLGQLKSERHSHRYEYGEDSAFRIDCHLIIPAV